MSTTGVSLPKKDVYRATTNVPLRFAILGAHKTSKSAFVSIISNQMSLPNYYPTIQNSPLLVQFQPKRFKSRALLDVHITPKDLKEVNLLDDETLQMDPKLLKRIDLEGLKQAKQQGVSPSLHHEDVTHLTQNHYDLDYSTWDMFDNDYFKPINSFGATAGEDKLKAGRGMHPNPLYFERGDSRTYKPPVSTPILIELIDTPGVEKDDLIPFLERSLDCRLSKDVLNNLANDYNTNFRSRVKPLITGSGISDLNASINGYLLCYSCVPEINSNEINPPSYNEKENAAGGQEQNYDNIDVLKSIYVSIFEAWKEWTTYHVNWEIGKEYDSQSLSTSIKQIWKKKELPLTELKDFGELSKGERKRLEKFIDKSEIPRRPPIVVACTHVDSPYASPMLIEQGKKLASEWGCSFVQMSCSYDAARWRNVEETLALLVREAADSEIRAL